ncbi:hypothetical protein [Escherichia phage phiA2-1]|nr:hypothetical protein [Escherichia phage phiA2-1]
MFNFSDNKLTTEEIIKIAESDGLPVISVAIEANGYKHSQYLWGHIGVYDVFKGSDLAIIIKNLEKFSKSGSYVVTVKTLHESVFAMREIGPHERLHDELIPQLEVMNIAFLIGNNIYINPALADSSWNPNFKAREDEHPS